jgi:hypothetical protein
VYNSDRKTKSGHQVEMNSGVAVVVPATRLLELVKRKDVAEHRRAAEAEMIQAIANGQRVRLVEGVSGTDRRDNADPATTRPA